MLPDATTRAIPRYKVILYLTNDATKLNIHPPDSVINDNEYQGNITNDGVPVY